MNSSSNVFDFTFLKKKLEKNGHLKLTVVTDSMSPHIKVGEEISIYPVDVKSLKPFDILVFDLNGRLTCHFFSSYQERDGQKEVLTRSYKNPRDNDYPTPYNKVLGKVVDRQFNFFQKFILVVRSILNR